MSRRRPARRLLVLAALLIALTWLLAGHLDTGRPALSVALVLTFCGGWASGVTGAARLLAVESEP